MNISTIASVGWWILLVVSSWQTGRYLGLHEWAMASHQATIVVLVLYIMRLHRRG